MKCQQQVGQEFYPQKKGKDKLNISRRLPPLEEFLTRYSLNRDEVLQECLAYQKYPYHRWRSGYRKDDNIEHYLMHPWTPIPWTDDRNGGISRLPFGYKKDPEKAEEWGLDPDSILFPIPDELFALEEARYLWKKYTPETVALWLTHKTGRKITKDALRRRFESERRRRNQSEIYKGWAVRLAKALIAAAKIEEEFPGSKFPFLRGRNYHGHPLRKRGNPAKTEEHKLEYLFSLVDPRPYIRAVWGSGRETEEGEAAEETTGSGTVYPSSLDDICGNGPTRGDVPPASG